MSVVDAQRFEAVAGGLLSEDRQHVLLRLRDHEDREFVVALPIAELPRLLYLADSLSSQEASGARDGRRTVFDAHRVEVGDSEDGCLSVLSVFGASGAPFRFALDRAVAHSLHVQLQRMTPALVPRARRS
jgi:hypothetical protein